MGRQREEADPRLRKWLQVPTQSPYPSPACYLPITSVNIVCAGAGGSGNFCVGGNTSCQAVNTYGGGGGGGLSFRNNIPVSPGDVITFVTGSAPALTSTGPTSGSPSYAYRGDGTVVQPNPSNLLVWAQGGALGMGADPGVPGTVPTGAGGCVFSATPGILTAATDLS